MTRIFFDATSLDPEPSGAKSRLLRLVPELADRGHQVVIAARERLEAPGSICVEASRGGPLLRWLRPAALARHVREARSDLAVFETWPAPRLPIPLIAVVHDLRHVHAGGVRRKLATAWFRDAAIRVRRLHAVSDATRAELEDLVPESRGRIDVVPNPVVLPADPPSAPLPPGLDGPFVFAAGHAEPRKGWAFVAAIAADLARLGIKVVRAGRGREAHENVLDLGVVSDPVLATLFCRAVAVLAPSRLEGFGLVPLEALASGAWVVASAIPAHREVLGDAAEYFALGDRAGAVARIRAAAGASGAARAARTESARARAAFYSPSRCADAFEASLRAAGF
jgi:glycosyltransferase involved in cell wall biosynthesis